ncbi:hypothetical protein [Desulfogranum japonicum]|uniref:hypothetical protein n=1 Tax=Desulfogranum japonicum TaxID=231447 RepID=UPI000421B4B4|nr:hypothetical protein [Desulfogranum japonicum]
MTTTGQAMKNSQDAPQRFEDYEDLTLFADESFNTEDVDLFEFTSEEDSVLTRLKAIILSLDWEISDDILQELADEVDNLQEMWQNDKIAEVYLQGLGKIGRYLRSKGAYAHPNAIKLLLTFFYNFEKIISSEKITETEITMLLKGDIRKFRILQFQINKTASTEQTVPTLPVEETVILTPSPEEEAVVSPEEEDHLRMLKASILSLDWEVTNESLEQFNIHLEHFQKQLTDDKPALVLVQGLRALGDYIIEERARAHPESFTLLHAFSDALEQVMHVVPEQRDQEQMRALLADRVGRLNGLKALIAEGPITPEDDGRLDEVVDEITSPVSFEEPVEQEEPEEESPAGPAAFFEPPPATSKSDGSIESELDDLFPSIAMPGMESSDTKYPDEILPPDAIHPVDDSVADNLIHAEVSGRRGFAPALSEAIDDSHGFSEDFEPLDVPTQTDLTEQLDRLFADNDTEESVSDIEPETSVAEQKEAELPPSSPDEDGILSALSDVDISEEEYAQPAEAGEKDELSQDIEDKLDFFFGDEEEKLEAVESESPAEPESEDAFSPALADSDEEGGFSEESSLATMDSSPLPDIEEKLDFFFNDEEENKDMLSVAEEEATPAVEEPVALEEISPAADDTMEEVFALSEEEELLDELEEEESLITELDSFLDADSEDETSDELTLSLEDELPVSMDAEPIAPVFEDEQEEIASLTETAELSDIESDIESVLDEEEEGSLADELSTFLEQSEDDHTTEELAFALEGESSENIDEESLDVFLGSTEDDEDGLLSEDIDELTRAIEGTIADKEQAPQVAAAVEMEAEPQEEAESTEPLEDRMMSLAALGSLLPGILQDPSLEKVEQACKHVVELQAHTTTPVEKVVLQLLSSGLTQLQFGNKPRTEQTASLFTYLYEKAYEGDKVENGLLPEIVGKYVGWQSEFVASMAPDQPTILPLASKPDPKQNVAATLDIDQVRRLIKEELAELQNTSN